MVFSLKAEAADGVRQMFTNNSGGWRDRKWISCFGFLLLLRVGVFNLLELRDHWRLREFDKSIMNGAVLGLPGFQKITNKSTGAALSFGRCGGCVLKNGGGHFTFFVAYAELGLSVQDESLTFFDVFKKVESTKVNTFLKEGGLELNGEKLMVLPNLRRHFRKRLFHTQQQTYSVQRQHRYLLTIYSASRCNLEIWKGIASDTAGDAAGAKHYEEAEGSRLGWAHKLTEGKYCTMTTTEVLRVWRPTPVSSALRLLLAWFEFLVVDYHRHGHLLASVHDVEYLLGLMAAVMRTTLCMAFCAIGAKKLNGAAPPGGREDTQLKYLDGK